MELRIKDFPDDLHKWAKKAAVDEDIPLRDFVISAFREYSVSPCFDCNLPKCECPKRLQERKNA